MFNSPHSPHRLINGIWIHPLNPGTKIFVRPGSDPWIGILGPFQSEEDLIMIHMSDLRRILEEIRILEDDLFEDENSL